MATFYSYPSDRPPRSKLGWREKELPWLLRRTRRTGRDVILAVRLGLFLGVFVALACSAVVLLPALFRHSAWLEAYEVSVWHVVGSYFLAFPLAGLVGGLLMPLTRWLVPTLLLGWICGSLVYGAVGRVAEPTLATTDWIKTSLLLGAVIGIPTSAYLYFDSKKRSRR